MHKRLSFGKNGPVKTVPTVPMAPALLYLFTFLINWIKDNYIRDVLDRFQLPACQTY